MDSASDSRCRARRGLSPPQDSAYAQHTRPLARQAVQVEGVPLEQGERARWFKLHAAVNVDTSEILAYLVSEPYMDDSLAFWRLIDMVLGQGHVVGCVLTDGAYDSK